MMLLTLILSWSLGCIPPGKLPLLFLTTSLPLSSSFQDKCSLPSSRLLGLRLLGTPGSTHTYRQSQRIKSFSIVHLLHSQTTVTKEHVAMTQERVPRYWCWLLQGVKDHPVTSTVFTRKRKVMAPSRLPEQAEQVSRRVGKTEDAFPEVLLIRVPKVLRGVTKNMCKG